MLLSISQDNHVFSCVLMSQFSCVFEVKPLDIFIDVVLCALGHHASASFVETVDKHKQSPTHPVVPIKEKPLDPQHLLKPVYGRRTWWPCCAVTLVYPLYWSSILSVCSPWRDWHPYLLFWWPSTTPQCKSHPLYTLFLCVCVWSLKANGWFISWKRKYIYISLVPHLA